MLCSVLIRPRRELVEQGNRMWRERAMTSAVQSNSITLSLQWICCVGIDLKCEREYEQGVGACVCVCMCFIPLSLTMPIFFVLGVEKIKDADAHLERACKRKVS